MFDQCENSEPTFTREQATAPAFDIVSISEQKDFSRIDGDSEDTLIERFIKSATIKAESFCGGGFASRNWVQWGDLGLIEGGFIEIKNLWVSAVSALYVYDIFDNEIEIDSSSYTLLDLDTTGTARIKFNYDYTFSADLRISRAFKIEYMAGKSTADEVPDDLKIAINTTVSQWYEERETINSFPFSAKSTLSDYKIRYR